MPSVYPSNPSVVDMMGTTFQMVAQQFLCLMTKMRRRNILIYILVVGTYFTKYGRSHTTSLWFGQIHIPTQNHLQTNSVFFQIAGEESLISHISGAWACHRELSRREDSFFYQIILPFCSTKNSSVHGDRLLS